MFVRSADFQITAVYDGTNIGDLRKEWNKVAHSGHICRDGSCPFVKQTSFDYDPTQFLYYRARAITTDVPNGNGDMFPYKEVQAAYKTFIGKGVFFNHNSEDPDNAFGIILDAVFHGQFNPAYVEILAALDREVTEEKHPGLIKKITNGISTSTSMSCLCERAECSICNNVAHNAMQLCAHMNPDSPNFVKGRKTSHGALTFEKNFELTFSEDSVVGIPADNTAHIFQVFASLRSANTLEEIRIRLSEISELLSKYD